jgi:Concanavalin A-like lectin/glucanases superfamily
MNLIELCIANEPRPTIGRPGNGLKRSSKGLLTMQTSIETICGNARTYGFAAALGEQSPPATRPWRSIGMNKTISFLALMVSLSFITLTSSAIAEGEATPSGKLLDWRYIKNGTLIPDENYCDQPYVVTLPNGRWVCIMTTGSGKEGHAKQHIVATHSDDRGKTWSELIDVEPAQERESSYAVPLVTSFGRIYAFYNFNEENVREINGKPMHRCDILGSFSYRYSDDGGESWSKKRHNLPMRKTAVDLQNEWAGKHIHFWCICKPKVDGEGAFFSFTKLQKYFLTNSEGWLFHSNNIMVEPDVEKLNWQMLPEGDGTGIKHPDFGSVQEEHNIVVLNDGTIYCVYRTMSGFACVSCSKDRGKTFSIPEKFRYKPGGRIIKTPRACPQLWKCKNGKYLLWIKNHSYPHYQTRNPVWLCGGIEKNGTIHWSEPEILLYDDNPTIGMSYPDMVEQDGHYWFFETQKYEARVHQVDPELIKSLWTQGEKNAVVTRGLVLVADHKVITSGPITMPDISFSERADAGVTFDFWLDSSKIVPGEYLFDARDSNGYGLSILVADDKTLQMTISDESSSMTWDTDSGLLTDGETHHIVAIVDANPQIMMFVIDGKVCDGGQNRFYGWRSADGMKVDQRSVGETAIDSNWNFDQPAMPKLSPMASRLDVSPSVISLRVYNRYLRVGEAISNYYILRRSSTHTPESLSPNFTTAKGWTRSVRAAR